MVGDGRLGGIARPRLRLAKGALVACDPWFLFFVDLLNPVCACVHMRLSFGLFVLLLSGWVCAVVAGVFSSCIRRACAARVDGCNTVPQTLQCPDAP